MSFFCFYQRIFGKLNHLKIFLEMQYTIWISLQLDASDKSVQIHVDISGI